jgi:hypothetical protein
MLVARLLLAIVIFAPQLVALDLISGLLTGADQGWLQLFRLWLSLMTKLVLLLHGSDIIAQVAVGAWAFIAFGVGFVRIVLRE